MSYKKKLGAISAIFTLIAPLNAISLSYAQEAPQSWVKLCTKDNNNQNICTTLSNVFSDTGQPLTTINIIDYDNQASSRRLQIAVPTGRRVQEGVTLQIDNNLTKKMDYLFCVGLSCVAEGALDNKLLANLKNGKKMVITSVNYEGIPNPIEVSLKGFNKAFTGPGMRPSDVAEQNQRLQENFDANNKKITDKVNAVQDKAKAEH